MIPRKPTYHYLPYPQGAPEQGYYEVIRNAWWAMHPQHGLLMYGTSPQCNHRQDVSEAINERIHPDHNVVFVSVAWVPINPRDYV